MVMCLAAVTVVLAGCGGGGGDPVEVQPVVRSVAVSNTGTGTGTVTSSPAGITCGSTCSASLSATTSIALTASAGTNSQFVEWSGACSGTTTSCTIPAGTGSVTASARFDLLQFVLTVTKAGNGSGTVTSAPSGINCGTDCTESVAAGTIVTLTAAPAASSTFTGWTGGGCTGTAPCAVTVNAATAVTATFALTTHTLTVARTGTGGGSVASLPAGITCGADCSEVYNYGTTVVLTATADAGSAFGGWSGAGCTGTATCQVTISQTATVTALFNSVASRWPDSFTRFCSNSTAAVACPGGPVGQDGFYLINVPTYVTTAGHVLDEVTGLIWERSPTVADISFAAALTYCGNLTLDGFTDWRVPAYLELVSIANFGSVGPAFPGAVFPGIPTNSSYWSSTERSGNVTQVVVLFTNYPITRLVDKAETSGRQVRCVRGTPFSGTFTNEGGDVRDGRTQLVWQDAVAPSSLSWQDALAYCEALTRNGHSDWRLPSGKELMSLSSLSTNDNGTPLAFTNRLNTNFWTSSVLANIASSGYVIAFTDGLSQGIDTPLDQLRDVRCVR